MATKHDILMANITARFQTIVPPTFYTNVGSNVFQYRSKIFEDHELPAINLFDDDEKKADEFAGNPPLINRDLTVTAEMIFKNGAASIGDARKGIADMEKAVGDDITFGGVALKTEYLGSSIAKQQNTDIVTGAKLMMLVTYRTTKWAES